MTKEHAIDLCQAIDKYLCAGNPIWDVKQIHDAMSMAIEALKEQKTGKWIEKPHEVFLPRDCLPKFFDETYNYDNHSIIEYWWHCSECDYEADRMLNPYHYKYCPNCGAKMEGENDESN